MTNNTIFTYHYYIYITSFCIMPWFEYVILGFFSIPHSSLLFGVKVSSMSRRGFFTKKGCKYFGFSVDYMPAKDDKDEKKNWCFVRLREMFLTFKCRG